MPPFKVLGNPVLITLAQARPTSPAQLQRVDGVSPRVIRRIGGEILEALRKAKELGPLNKAPILPSRDGTGELDEASYELHERLKVWRKKAAIAENMDASLILNRHVLLRLAAERPTDAKSLAAIDGMQPWQCERYGDAILEVCADLARDLESGKLNERRRRRSRRDG